MEHSELPAVQSYRPWQQGLARGLAANYAANKLHHALLLLGPAGMGKRVFASVFARFLLCKQLQPSTEGIGCGQCDACTLLKAETHPDYHLLSLAADSQVISIDSVRALRDKLQTTAQQQGGKVCVISPADKLNENSASALLKMLEEPPSGTFFVLVADKPQYVLPTIRSRCLPVQFQLPATDELAQFLATFGKSQHTVNRCIQQSRGFPEIAIDLLGSPVGHSDNESLSQAEWGSQALLECFLRAELPASKLLPTLAKKNLEATVEQLQRESHAGFVCHYIGVEAFEGLAPLSTDRFNFTERQWLALQSVLLEAKAQLKTNPNPLLFLEALLSRCHSVTRPC